MSADDPTNVELYTSALVGPVQTLADAIRAVIASRNINDTENCVGVSIDALGKLVGRPRDGIADDEIYRRYVRAQITVNKSDGMVEDLIAVGVLVVGDAAASFRLYNFNNASLDYDVQGVVLADAVSALLVKLLKKAVDAGVKIFVHWLAAPLTETFRYDVGPGYDVGKYAP